jgi:hypothetical protein
VATKLTPEEKEARKLAKKAELEAEKLRYEQERAAQIAAYKAGLPKRIKDAQILAYHVGVASHVELTETGPAVRFEYEDHLHKIYIDRTLTYESDEWEVEDVEVDLQKIKAQQEAYAAQRSVAQSIFGNLTPEEKTAIKEHIHYLK